MFNALVDVANKPSDTSSRQVVLARAGEFASKLPPPAGRSETLQRGVTEELKASVTQANMLARRVAELNRRIASATGSGQTPNDLLDQRDQAISETQRLRAGDHHRRRRRHREPCSSAAARSWCWARRRRW